MTAGLFPSFATEWVGAVTGEGPHVMQGKYQWCLSGESWQLTEVKIVAKKIVCMDDLRTRGDKIGQPFGCRLMEVFPTIDLS